MIDLAIALLIFCAATVLFLVLPKVIKAAADNSNQRKLAKEGDTESYVSKAPAQISADSLDSEPPLTTCYEEPHLAAAQNDPKNACLYSEANFDSHLFPGEVQLQKVEEARADNFKNEVPNEPEEHAIEALLHTETYVEPNGELIISGNVVSEPSPEAYTNQDVVATPQCDASLVAEGDRTSASEQSANTSQPRLEQQNANLRSPEVASERPPHSAHSVPSPGAIRIVARLKGQAWHIGIELSPLPRDTSSIVLRQGNSSLEFESSINRWLLNNPNEVITSEDKSLIDSFMPSPFSEPILLFRIGRDIDCFSTSNIGQGDFLLVAPESWEIVSGASTAPDRTTMAGFLAHHVSMHEERQQEITFRKPDNTVITIKKPPVPELFGSLLESGYVDGIATYGGRTIGLRLQSAEDWIHYKELRLTDGSGRTACISISYDLREQSMDMPPNALGIYRVDAIDTHGRQRWSEKFRYASGISALRMELPLPVPETDGAGHSTVPLRFKHDESWRVHTNATVPFLLSKPGQSDFLIPATQTFDLTHWICETENRLLTIPVLIERLWWYIEKENMCASPISLTGVDFLPSSERTLTVRFPRPRWISSLKAGFSEKTARKYAVRVNENVLPIKLREFTDSTELTNFGIHDFFIWFEHSGVEYETVIARISIGAKCKLCDKRSKSSFEMAEHLSNCHIRELSRPLTSKELERMASRLPSFLFKCRGCEHVLVLASGTSSDSLLSKHLTGGCTNLTTSRDAIILLAAQNELLRDLETCKACQHCAQIFQGSDDLSLAEHFLASHRSTVIALSRSSDD